MESQPAARGDSLFLTDNASTLWSQSAAARASFLRPATELMLELANLRPGSRVLDVAAGTGEQSILAAQRVLPGGSVLATDLSETMVKGAQQAAQEAGLHNIEARVMDAEHLELEADSFDAAISRLGVMLVEDPGVVFSGVRRVLKSGASFAVVVHGAEERNFWGNIPLHAICQPGRLPNLDRREIGMFSLGQTGLLTELYETAGYRDIVERTVDQTRRYATFDEAVAALTGGVVWGPLLARLNDAERAEAIREIEDAIRDFDGPNGVSLPGEAIVGVGRT